MHLNLMTLPIRSLSRISWGKIYLAFSPLNLVMCYYLLCWDILTLYRVNHKAIALIHAIMCLRITVTNLSLVNLRDRLMAIH